MQSERRVVKIRNLNELGTIIDIQLRHISVERTRRARKRSFNRAATLMTVLGISSNKRSIEAIGVGLDETGQPVALIVEKNDENMGP